MSEKTITDLSVQLFEACRAHGIMIATAESCTGGGIAMHLTDIPGSSAVVDRGFVTYSNAAKIDMLGVTSQTLDRHGAVSEETALEMASGALDRSRAGLAISVTGIAGPDGGSDDKPVGLVWFGVALKGQKPIAEKRIFDNEGRDFIRKQAIATALELGLKTLSDAP
ncbi:MAG: CinA family protein [Mesorhizobium sp.]